MTTYQTGANMLVALKRETSTGVAAGATGATHMRLLASPGLELKRANIQSQEKRSDMLMTLARLGAKSVPGSYNAELTVGGATDILLEAIMRGAWSAATALTTATGAGACVDITADSTSTLTRTGTGSYITDGWRVGDVAVLTNYSTAANNNINLPVVGVTATVLTVQGTPLTTGSADTSCVLTRQKKLVNGATPTRYTHTVEQYYTDIDLSEQFLGVRAIGVKLSFKPGATATITYTLLGMDRTVLTTGTSPYFSSPSLTTGLDLIADDSSIRYNGNVVTNFTGFDLDFTITAKTEPVLGTFVSPDVFDNDLAVSGSITALRSDLSNLASFDAETEFGIHTLLQEPSGSPKAFLNFYLPRVKIGGVSASLFGNGAMTETLPLLIGAYAADSTHDAGYANISSSAA